MTSVQHEEQAALVALLRVRPRKMKWPELMARVIDTGSAAELWEMLSEDALIRDPTEGDPLAEARADVEAWAAEGLGLHTVLDREYPRRLRAVHQAPPVLFSRGTPAPAERAVSVVGSRAASAEGLKRADAIARALVEEGITVLSGLAEGIDAAAHSAALEAGGRTVAVIGTGIRNYFPAKNRQLQDTIAARGLVLSQFWPDAPPTRYTFPMRNATMSGYGVATVVVEAGEQSGARIQARVAVEHGRPVILTDLVVSRNRWAADMIGRPGVHQAATLAEVMDAIRSIYLERDQAREAVRTLLKL